MKLEEWVERLGLRAIIRIPRQRARIPNGGTATAVAYGAS
jgi:hypothetical protein